MDGMKTYFYLDRPGAGDLIAITNEEEFQQAFSGGELKYVSPFLNNTRPHPKDIPFQIHHFQMMSLSCTDTNNDLTNKIGNAIWNQIIILVFHLPDYNIQLFQG